MTTPERSWRTARLIAKPAASQDAAIIFTSYATDPAVTRFLTWKPHQSVDDTLRFLERCERVWEEGSACPWTLWLDDGDLFAGMLEARVRGHAMDFGYALARQWWGRGLMSEAVEALVTWGLAQPELFRIWATCDVENIASARLLERVGMQREGVLRRWLVHPNAGDEPRDCFCYSRVKPR